MPRKTIPSAALFARGAPRPLLDWDCLLEHLFREHLPSKEDARTIIAAAAELLG